MVANEAAGVYAAVSVARALDLDLDLALRLALHTDLGVTLAACSALLAAQPGAVA